MRLKVAKKTKSKEEQKVTAVAPVEPGFISLSLSKEELETLANLLGVTARTFENLPLQAAQQNDEETYQVLAVLSNHFASKLLEFFKMPEPSSRDIH